MRPQAAFPFGWGRNAVSDLARGLRMEPPFGSAALRASIRIATRRISCFSVNRPLHSHSRVYPPQTIMSEQSAKADDPLASKSTAWSGRFDEPVADFVLRYTASIGFDRRLALVDIEGSLAHA